MNKKQKLFLFLIACFPLLVTLGFNTLDWQINTFAWDPPTNGIWHMNTWFSWDFWNCYMFFGVIPFALGCFLWGLTAALVLRSLEGE